MQLSSFYDRELLAFLASNIGHKDQTLSWYCYSKLFPSLHMRITLPDNEVKLPNIFDTKLRI